MPESPQALSERTHVRSARGPMRGMTGDYRGAGALADLDETQGRAQRGDDVELAAFRAPVARDDAVALFFQEQGGARLGVFAVVARFHGVLPPLALASLPLPTSLVGSTPRKLRRWSGVGPCARSAA